MGIGRRALRKVGLATLRSNAALVKRFFDLLFPDLLFPFNPGPDEFAQKVTRSLANLSLDVLPVPEEFAPATQREIILSQQDAVAMLRQIAAAIEALPLEEQGNSLSHLATRVLERCGQNRKAILAQCNSLPIFAVYDCRQGQRAKLSWEHIKSAWDAKCLFRGNPSDLAQALQEALGDRRIVLIDSQLASALWSEGTVVSCLYTRVGC